MESDEPAQEVNGEGIPEATSTVTDAPEQTGGDQVWMFDMTDRRLI